MEVEVAERQWRCYYERCGAGKKNVNAITFNGRYSMVTYDGSHFSQLGTTFLATLNFKL